jgi:hypothetical protein
MSMSWVGKGKLSLLFVEIILFVIICIHLLERSVAFHFEMGRRPVLFFNNQVDVSGFRFHFNL